VNEYQDQVTWFRLEAGVDREFVGDFDSMFEAEEAAFKLPEGTPLHFRRMSGLPG
jgi:hypothetical protein